MTETTKMAEIAKESNGKKDKKQNLWKMFRRKKGNNTTSTTKKSKSQTDNSKDILGNLFFKKSFFSRLFFTPQEVVVWKYDPNISFEKS